MCVWLSNGAPHSHRMFIHPQQRQPCDIIFHQTEKWLLWVTVQWKLIRLSRCCLVEAFNLKVLGLCNNNHEWHHWRESRHHGRVCHFPEHITGRAAILLTCCALNCLCDYLVMMFGEFKINIKHCKHAKPSEWMKKWLMITGSQPAAMNAMLEVDACM